MSDEDTEEFDRSVDDGDDADEGPLADVEGVDIEDDPFSDFDVGDATEAGDSSADSLFMEVEVSDLDDDEVWAQFGEEESTSDPAEAEPDPVAAESEAAEEVADAATSDERVVEKRAYCEQCEYFSKPPDVACTYPNSDIVELVDTERFRVRNCPIVARRENSDITAIAGGDTEDSELEPGDPTSASDSGSDD